MCEKGKFDVTIVAIGKLFFPAVKENVECPGSSVHDILILDFNDL